MNVNLLAGWIGLLAGVVVGAGIGLFFHREDWMGGYGSFRRRLVRLGHISLIGLGILNILFGVTCAYLDLHGSVVVIAAWMLVAGAATMPACCFLTAWKEPFRTLFFVPVLLVSGNIVLLLISWPR